jgi:hypothetical protein
MISNPTEAENALDAVGQILQAEGFEFAIVVIGGAALTRVVDHVQQRLG